MVKACNEVSYGKLNIRGFDSLQVHTKFTVMENNKNQENDIQDKDELTIHDFPGDNMIEE